MAPTESTPSEIPSALDSSNRPQSATERIARALDRDGYDVTYRDNETVRPARSRRVTEFVEVEISSGERDQLAAYIEELEPSDSHRVIGPADTPALREWPSGPAKQDITRTVIIAPLPLNRYTPEEKDSLRASHL